MKTKKTSQSYKDLLKLNLLGIVVIFLISLPLNDLLLNIKLSLAYLLFMYVPFLPLVCKINTGIVEKFLLTNLLGLSYASVYVVLDVILKIPLTKMIYIVMTLLIALFSWVPYFNFKLKL